MHPKVAPAALVLLLSLAFPQPSAGADEDDPPPSCPTPTGQCPVLQQYAAIKEYGFAFLKAGDCSIRLQAEYEGWIRRCVSLSEPPPEVALNCYREPGGVTCEASPAGPELTYTWILTGGLSSALVAPWSPYLSATCSPVQHHAGVQVYVSGPGGAYGHASVAMSCDLSDHGQPVH